MRNGNLIVFEGPEGSGKDTQIPLFKNFLDNWKISCKSFREPGTTEVGKKLRNYLLHDKKADLNPIQEAVLFNASRIAMFVEEVNPALERGETVILNRSFYSTLVYQIRAHEIAGKTSLDYISPINPKEAKTIEDLTLGVVKNYIPDLTFILDVPPELGLFRCGKNKDKFESRNIEYHKGVREGYLELPKRFENCVVIDGTKSIRDVSNDIILKYCEVVYS